jgi:hypothetical protein
MKRGSQRKADVNIEIQTPAKPPQTPDAASSNADAQSFKLATAKPKLAGTCSSQ